MKELREAHAKTLEASGQREGRLQEQLSGFVAKDDFREFRTEIRGEIRDNFKAVFDKIDGIIDRLPSKQVP